MSSRIAIIKEPTNDLAIIAKYRLSSMALNIIIEAYKFLPTNSFFMYVRGPFIEPSPKMRVRIAIEKHITNLSGDPTAAPVMIINKVRKPKKVDSVNEMPAWIKFLSFGRQLKTLSHPWGSGS